MIFKPGDLAVELSLVPREMNVTIARSEVGFKIKLAFDLSRHN